MKTTFGIIGYGRFGRLWAKHLSKLGKVLVYDKNPGTRITGKNLIKASLRQAARADVLFLLVPISELARCCQQIRDNILPNTVIVDACSVKVYPVAVLKKNLNPGQPIIATHPLFGPDSAGKAKTLAGYKIAVCPVRATSAQLAAFENNLKKLGLKIFRTTPKNHDRQMATSQGLIHFLGRGLANLNLKPQDIATPDYLSLLHIRDMVVHDTWQLFFDMQKYNPYVKPVRRKFLFNLMKIAAALGPHKKSVKNIRGQIDHLDEVIIKSIAQRMDLSQKMGTVKKHQGIKVLDKQRERQLALRHNQLSKKEGLDPVEIKKLFSLLMRYSRKVQ
jgi:prephenate dehydrogenase